MNSAEIPIGIVVTLILAVLLAYVIFKVWALEKERPTETIIPK